MNKQAYLAQLKELLAPLPEQERQDALNYYEEYFDVAGPEAEDATAAELGDPAEAARKILEGEGLTLDSTVQPAAGEKSTSDTDAVDSSNTAQSDSTPPAGDDNSTAHHGPAAIPPVVGILLGIAAVLVVIIMVFVLLFGVRGSSISNTAKTFVVSAVESAVEPPQDADPATETPGSEIATEESDGTVDDNSPHAMDMTFDSITPWDAVLDIDYGRLTIVLDTGATSAALHCENVYSKRFDVTYVENEPLTIRYKVPANCDLNSEPEPEFVLSVPDADIFHFKNLAITSAMGDVEFDNNEIITADSIELDLAMGDFTCSTVQTENFYATVAMGNFTGGLVQCSSFTADVAMGNFDLGRLEKAQTCTVKAGMGNIGLTVDGKPDDYALDLQASMGEVAFNGKTLGTSCTQTPTAARSVTLTAGMGDVVLTTTE